MHSTPTHPDAIDRLLLLCLNGRALADHPLQNVSESDWAELARRANKHRVAGLVNYRLEQLKAAHQDPGLPDAASSSLNAAYINIALRNMGLFAELNHVLKAFHASGIPVAVLKGAHLIQSVYCNPGVRWMNDLDLLVHQSDLPAAEQQLAELGFRLLGGREWYTRNHFHYQYVHPERNARVELHWHLEPPGSPFTVDLKALWERTRPEIFSAISARVLSPEDLLLHLSLQVAFQHPFDYFALRTMGDIAALLSWKPANLNWAEIIRLAGEWKARRCVHLTLRLAQQLFGSAIPAAALAALEPEGFNPSLIAWAEERVFAVGDELAYLPEPEAMSERFGLLLSSDDLRARLTALFHTLFPPPAVIRQQYALPTGSTRTSWYYLVRMKDLAGRHLSKALRLVKRDPNTLVWVRLESRRIALVSWITPSSERLDG